MTRNKKYKNFDNYVDDIIDFGKNIKKVINGFNDYNHDFKRNKSNKINKKTNNIKYNPFINKCDDLNLVRKLIIEDEINPSIFDSYVLTKSVELNNMALIKFTLMDVRVNPSAKNNYALSKALIDNNIELLDLLINDSRINFKNLNESIKHAIKKGNIEAIRILSNHFDMSSFKLVFINKAILSKNLEMFETIMESQMVKKYFYDNKNILYNIINSGSLPNDFITYMNKYRNNIYYIN